MSTRPDTIGFISVSPPVIYYFFYPWLHIASDLPGDRGSPPYLTYPYTVPVQSTRDILQLGIMLMARDRIMTIVKSDIVLSIIINILARRVSGKASVGLKAVAVLYPRYK
jgi:hypothetical protein